ncbi:hypothetical protein F3Y22_tig00111837pilonHSYRG00522 [Hibiscus syriacus]|uniref:Uncharacterized protein n=1 Tax=Hibiscus syriacus TaxID=106335 RepID=A0A6A2Y7J1_HIBSY|nr:hypothetical protein F3Y22_tig00111837pilonHSYRG00522 [Hibiscus syriacus]
MVFNNENTLWIWSDFALIWLSLTHVMTPFGSSVEAGSLAVVKGEARLVRQQRVPLDDLALFGGGDSRLLDDSFRVLIP